MRCLKRYHHLEIKNTQRERERESETFFENCDAFIIKHDAYNQIALPNIK